MSAPVNGLDGQDIRVDDRVQRLSAIASEMADLIPPRSRSLTPLVSGEVPVKIKMTGGGYAESSHLRAEDIAEDQPQKIEVS